MRLAGGTALRLWLLAGAAACAELPRGIVVPAVPCQANPRCSYALYLPSNYSAGGAWPVLYCFDPLARGAVPVERFREGAERFGYILAGSNDSRNGPPDASLKAATAMWDDTHARLRVDESRVYAAGFSGGARLVSGLAAGTRLFAGTVLCGAGLATGLSPEGIAFPVFGTAGLEDFNYFELRRLGRALDATAAPHRIEIFDGGHDWPPPALAASALEWFDLAAMRAGTRRPDPELIARFLERETGAARKSEAAGEIAAAAAAYGGLAADLKGLADTAAFEKKALELARSPECKREEKREQREAEEYERLTSETLRRAQQGDPDERTRWIRLLRDRAEKDRNAEARRQAKRVLTGVSIYAASTAGGLLATGDYAGAAPWLELQLDVRGSNPLLEYQLACAYARAGRRQRARDAWRRALADGLGFYFFEFLAICRM